MLGRGLEQLHVLEEGLLVGAPVIRAVPREVAELQAVHLQRVGCVAGEPAVSTLRWLSVRTLASALNTRLGTAQAMSPSSKPCSTACMKKPAMQPWAEAEEGLAGFLVVEPAARAQG